MPLQVYTTEAGTQASWTTNAFRKFTSKHYSSAAMPAEDPPSFTLRLFSVDEGGSARPSYLGRSRWVTASLSAIPDPFLLCDGFLTGFAYYIYAGSS